MCTVLPKIAESDWLTELVTITAMYAGSGPAGGGVLLPGSAVQLMRQLGVVGFSAKPLKLAGAGPPLTELSFPHCAPQKVTDVPMTLLPSPIAKAPPPGAKAKVSNWQEAVAEAPPTSLIEVLIVKLPVLAYMCEPLAVYGPPFGPPTVPAELEPSPQSIVVVKSERVPPGLAASMKVALGPLKDWVKFAGAAQTAVSAASPTWAIPWAEVVLPPSSWTAPFVA